MSRVGLGGWQRLVLRSWVDGWGGVDGNGDGDSDGKGGRVLISRLDSGMESWFENIPVRRSGCGIARDIMVDTCRMRMRKEMIMILVFMVLACALGVDMGCNFLLQEVNTWRGWRGGRLF